MHNINNDGNVLFSQVPTKMRHTNLKLKGVTLATKQEEACMSRRQHWPLARQQLVPSSVPTSRAGCFVQAIFPPASPLKAG